MKNKIIRCLGLAGLLALAICPAARAQSFSVTSHTIGGGGGSSTNSQFTVAGTIGQLDASTAMTNGQYSASSGFWVMPQVIQTSGAPTLYISQSGSTVTVYWQDATGWNLVQSGDLTTPVASWSASSAPTLTGGTNYLNLVNPAGNLFFRLKNP